MNKYSISWLRAFVLFFTSSGEAAPKVGEVDLLVRTSKDDPRFSRNIEMVGTIIRDI